MEENTRTLKDVKDQLKGYYKAHKMLNKENRTLQGIVAKMEHEIELNLQKMEMIEKGIEICKAEKKFLEEVAEVDKWENDKFTEEWYDRLVDECMARDEAEEAIIQVGKSFYHVPEGFLASNGAKTPVIIVEETLIQPEKRFYHVPDTDFEIDLIDIRRENK